MKSKLHILFILITAGLFTLALDFAPPTPPGPIDPYLNGIFSETAPGEVGSWGVEEAYPDITIPSPLLMKPFPGTSDLMVLSKLGVVYRTSVETQETSTLLDITDRSFKKGEAGTTGMVLHPEFGNDLEPDKQLIYIFYRHKHLPDEWSERGFNRLSKFAWDEASQTFDRNTEEILIQQYDTCSWHNGGGLHFGPDGFLYLAVGDEGFEENQRRSTQRIDGGLFSGILRIDVDNDPTRSHPIRRQPVAFSEVPSSWPDKATYTQGYSIPNDNPWLSTDGSILEEFYAIGLRSPFSTIYDPLEDQIWTLDVGSDKREEINRVNREDNLQWPYIEGTRKSDEHEKPTQLIGNEKKPIYEYERSVGSAAMGGGIYRGAKFPSLFGKYLFADFTQNKVMSLAFLGNAALDAHQTLIPDLESEGISLLEESGITGVHITEDGEVLIMVSSAANEWQDAGKILRLTQSVIVPDPPALLSETGVFVDLENLEPISELIPYTVNAPLWSDRATKQRWMAIPNQAGLSLEEQQIKFQSRGNWTFPEGTVFVKHFDLPTTTDIEGPMAKVETRFFIIGKDQEAYGVTYKWNEEGTDAELLRIGDSRDFDIMEGGELAFTQTWDYPSRDQCISCHNTKAGSVLGVNTHQMNGDYYYRDLGKEMNQIEYLSATGILNQEISNASNLHKSYNIEDGAVDLGLRIRSYLDSNCASCHRLGGVSMISLDFRYDLPLKFHNSINFPTLSQASNLDHLIIEPGNHAESELWVRDASSDDNKMPPLARNIVDQVYVDSLAKWIDGLTLEDGINDEFLLFPNPSDGYVYARFSDEWDQPIVITIYSTSGKLMHSSISESTTAYIEVSDYSAGTYILRATNRELKLVKKFVVQ